MKHTELTALFEREFATYIKQKKEGIPDLLYEGMLYATEGGGKRVRPTLCLLTADMLSISAEEVLPLAIAVELIHSYSLVHDDIMDGDDMRRGKESVYKKYGVNMAILIGDALLNLAYETLLSLPEKYLQAAAFISKCAGGLGMVGGQCLDLSILNNGKIENTQMLNIADLKTKMLISASIVPVGIYCGLDTEKLDALTSFSCAVGMSFQLSDDLIDIEFEDNLAKAYGKEKTISTLKQYYADGCYSLNCFERNAVILDYFYALTCRDR